MSFSENGSKISKVAITMALRMGITQDIVDQAVERLCKFVFLLSLHTSLLSQLQMKNVLHVQNSIIVLLQNRQKKRFIQQKWHNLPEKKNLKILKILQP